ncbi:MAG: STAS/SEC14 domain-containing protein [Balneolales bacterium]
MFRVKKGAGNVIELYVSERIQTEDYAIFVPLLEEKVREFGTVNLYCEIKRIEGVEPQAIGKDLKLGVRHFNSFEKVAVLGQKKWIEWMSHLAKPFTSGEVKIFEPEEKEVARSWILASQKEHQK